MDALTRSTNIKNQKSPKLKFNFPQNTFSIIIAQQSLPPVKQQYFFPNIDVSKKYEETIQISRKKPKQKMKIKAIEKVTISKDLSQNILENYRKTQFDSKFDKKFDNKFDGKFENKYDNKFENRFDNFEIKFESKMKNKFGNKFEDKFGNFENKFDKFENILDKTRERCMSETIERKETEEGEGKNRRASELVDQLLLDIYGRANFGNGRIFDTEYGSSTSIRSMHDKFDEKLQFSRLKLKDVTELEILIGALRERVTYAGNLLVKQLKKRDALKSKQEKICNVITAHLHAYSGKTSEDTNMRFSPNPVPGDSGFNQWRDAMKMVAKLPGGIPPEFRKKLWIALAEKHLTSKGVNWAQTEKLCFNEWSNPDDSELGIQIVKDLHRTGCSLFCGAAGQENQALLKRVLLAYARWNKSVGYCQGFNMLAALILQVMDKNETDSVKVMIYLIEGVLPESYFANNLRGLSVDMIVFRDLLKIRLPVLSKHLEALQNDGRDGNSYEPPLTNVFTMQWFLTLFCNCLPQTTVLRVWDLIFLEGNEILLRTAIAIWEKLSDRILAVNSADEFYSIMGVLTREMLEFGLVDSNTLIKSIVAIGTCSELNEMRDRYLYNITPWTQSVQTAAKKGFKLFYSDDDEAESDYDEKAAVTAAYGISIGRKRDKQQSNTREGTVIQPYAHGHPDRERLALDISALKKQYAKLRERQRQAHIILQAACARQPMGQNSTSGPIAMNHLLLGKNAIVNSRGRRLGPPKGSIPPARAKEQVKKKLEKRETVPMVETIHWKDTAKFRRRQSYSAYSEDTDNSQETFNPESDSSSYSEDDSSSTSTELCDEPTRISDFDSDDKYSDIENKKTDKIKHNLTDEPSSDISQKTSGNTDQQVEKLNLIEVVEMKEEIKGLISEIELKTVEIAPLIDIQTNSAFSDTSDLKISDIQCKLSDLDDAKLTINNEDQLNIISEVSESKLLDFSNEPTDENIPQENSEANIINLEPKSSEENLVKYNLLSSSPVKNEDANNSTQITQINNTIATNLQTIDDLTINEPKIEENTSSNIIESPEKEEENFESFLQERVKILKETSSESLYSPKSFPKEETFLQEHVKILKETSSDSLSSPKEERVKILKETSSDRLSYPKEEPFFQEHVKILQETSSDRLSSPKEETFIQEHVKILKEISPDSLSCPKEEPFFQERVKILKETSSDSLSSLKEEPVLQERVKILKETSSDSVSSPKEEPFLQGHIKILKEPSPDSLFSPKEEPFLQERVKILKEVSSDSLSSRKESLKEDSTSLKPLEDKLRRHKSYEETTANHLEKSVIFKQKSFDIGMLPIIETSLWKPYQIEEESPREETIDKLTLEQDSTDAKIFLEAGHTKVKKQASVDLLTVEDKRLELGRRNSERALKIIQENSLILHRILQQQKSSEKEDSEDELSRSPISKTFLRSESLLSKDEKTDEERSSTAGDEELESGVESFSVSPALLDEESDRSMKKDYEETLIISRHESSLTTDTQFSFRYQNSDDTSNIISSSIFEDNTKIEEKNSQMEISPISTAPLKTYEDDSPIISEETTKYDVASNILDYSKDIEDISSSSIPSDNNKYTVEEYTNIEEKSIELNNETEKTSEEKSPYRFSYKYKEESEENINITDLKSELENVEISQEIEESTNDSKHRELLSFLSDTSSKVSSNTSQKKNEDFLLEEKSPEASGNKYSEEFLSYLKTESKEDTYDYKQKEQKEESPSPQFEYNYSKSSDSSPYKYKFREDSEDNIKDKFSSYFQEETTPATSKYYSSISPSSTEDKYSSSYKDNSTPKSSLNEEISASKYTYKYALDSPEYSKAITGKEETKSSLVFQQSPDIPFSSKYPLDTPDLTPVKSSNTIDSNTKSLIYLQDLSESSFSTNYSQVKSDLIPVKSNNTSESKTISSIYPKDSPESTFSSNYPQIKSDLPLGKSSSTIEENTKSVIYLHDSPDSTFSSPLLQKKLDLTIVDNTNTVEDNSNLTSFETTTKDSTKSKTYLLDSPEPKFSSKYSNIKSDLTPVKSSNTKEETTRSLVHLYDSPEETYSPPFLQKKLDLSSIKSSHTIEDSSNLTLVKDAIPSSAKPTLYLLDSPGPKFSSNYSQATSDLTPIKTSSKVEESTKSSLFIQETTESRFSSTYNQIKPDITLIKTIDTNNDNNKSSLCLQSTPEPTFSSTYCRDKLDLLFASNFTQNPIDLTPADSTSDDNIKASMYLYDTPEEKFSSYSKNKQDLTPIKTSNDSDNNLSLSKDSKEYQHNKKHSTIDLQSSKFEDPPPEISSPKHLSCLQFSSFQADIPCTSKALQFTPICAKEKEATPEKTSPTKSPKYFSSFNLPTLSPPRRSVKSPLSPNKTFSPFPVQPTTRQPKELGVKLGLYKDLSPMKSPK